MKIGNNKEATRGINFFMIENLNQSGHSGLAHFIDFAPNLLFTMDFDMQMVTNLIRSRRSTFPKQFDPARKIDDEVIWQILENATWAPNHGQTEPWHFVVFSGEGLQKLATFQSELYKAEAKEFKQATYEKFQVQPLAASHIIAICMKRSPTAKVPEIEEVEAVACAVQNIYLSITALQIGGYWTTGGVTYYENAKPFFGLEAADRLLGFFYLGQIAVPSPRGKRIPVSEKTVWIK